MPLKNLFIVIIATILLTSILYSNLDNVSELFQEITGYTSIVIYGTVEAPSTAPESPTLTATVESPKETAQQPIQPTQAVVATTEVEKKEYVNKTILLQVINQTEDLRLKLSELRASSRDVLEYYSSIDDTENTEKWLNIVVQFNQAINDAGKIKAHAENVVDSATKEDVSTIKSMIGGTLKTLDKIVNLIKG